MTPCRCGAYHFPHRKGGGRCGKEAAAARGHFAEMVRQAGLLAREWIQLERQAEAELERRCL